MVAQQSKKNLSRFHWRKSTPNDIVEVAANMRQEDIEEIYAYSGSNPKSSLIYCYFASQPCMTMVGRKGNLMGMYGVVPCSAKVGRIWMLGHKTMTDEHQAAELQRLVWRNTNTRLRSIYSQYKNSQN